jgi:hypothetical protein
MNKPVYHQCPFLAEDRLSPSWLGGLLRVDAEARSNYLGALCVPIAEAQAAVFDVSFGENRHSNSTNQRQRARSGHVVRLYAFIGSN